MVCSAESFGYVIHSRPMKKPSDCILQCKLSRSLHSKEDVDDFVL